MKRIGRGVGYALVAYIVTYCAMRTSVGPWDFTVLLTRPLAGLLALVAAIFAFRLGWRQTAWLVEQQEREEGAAPGA